MLEGKQETDWGYVSSVMAAIYNTVRDPKKKPRPFTANEFNPFASQGKVKPTKTISVSEWAAMSKGKKIVKGK